MDGEHAGDSAAGFIPAPGGGPGSACEKSACFGVGGGENEAKRMRGTTSLQAKLLRPARRQNAFLNFSLKYAHMQNRGKEQMEK